MSLKITANIATYPGREAELPLMLESIRGQFDEVRVWYNGSYDEIDNYGYIIDFIDLLMTDCADLTDNGKFYFIPNEPEYYLTLDDDLIYPPTYAQDMKSAIDKYGCIVTHHGRTINPRGKNYYRGHKMYHCLHTSFHNKLIDIAGTGVCGFRTDYFKPDIWADDRLKMSDLLFSLEAAKQGKKIRILPHKKGYFRDLNPEQTIYKEYRGKPTPEHDKIVKQIYKLKYGKEN